MKNVSRIANKLPHRFTSRVREQTNSSKLRPIVSLKAIILCRNWMIGIVIHAYLRTYGRGSVRNLMIRRIVAFGIVIDCFAS